MRLQTSSATREQWNGALWQNEIDLAKTVFGSTIPYDKIFVANINMGTGAVTVATNPVRSSANYLLLWGSLYNSNATDITFRDTFIHELTHVWQAEHGSFAMAYMAESVWSQLSEGTREIFKDGVQEGLRRVRDIIRNGVQEWNHYRDRAYHFSMNDIGQNWNSFNVEQQAGIVETWFSPTGKSLGSNQIPGGRLSPKDVRFPYIKDNILAKSISAVYAPIQNPTGYSAEIADIQATLLALGYLTDPKYVDGFMGNVTQTAVRAFQTRNGLSADSDIGGPNSLTRRKLRQNINTLVRAR